MAQIVHRSSVASVSRRGVEPTGLAAHRRGGALKGCLIALAIVAVIAIGIGIWVAMSWKSWTAGALKAGAEAVVTQSGLAQGDKDRIIARVGAVADEFKNGTVSTQQLGEVIGAITTGPIIPAGLLMTAESKFIATSALVDAEKADAKLSFQRATRGLLEGKISLPDISPVLDPLTTVDQNGNRSLKTSVTVEDLKAAAAAAKSKADAASIPVEAYVANLGDELDKAVNKALGRP
jgi:hypothetical protein